MPMPHHQQLEEETTQPKAQATAKSLICQRKSKKQERFYHTARVVQLLQASELNRRLTSPRKIAERRTEKKGSMALIVCVNDTATFPRLMFVKRLPMVWTIARGRIAKSWETRTAPTLILMHHVYTESLPDKTKYSPGHQKSLAF